MLFRTAEKARLVDVEVDFLVISGLFQIFMRMRRKKTLA